MTPTDADRVLLEEVVMLDLSRHTETMFSKLDGLDKATFNILVRMARNQARAEGKAEGLEAGAKLIEACNCGVEPHTVWCSRWLAAAIRRAAKEA